MSESHLRDDHDVEQILKLAVRGAGISDEEALRQRLAAAGHELGLTETQIAAAEQQYFREKEESEERREFHYKRRKEFLEHLWSYLIVNAGLLGFDFFRDGRLSWALWPLIMWGIGVAFHALNTYLTGTEEYEKEFTKWRRQRNRNRRRRQKKDQPEEAG